MKKIHVTVKWLQNFNPCAEGLRRFKDTFPAGVTLYSDERKNVGSMMRAYEAEIGLEFPLRWVCPIPDMMTGCSCEECYPPEDRRVGAPGRAPYYDDGAFPQWVAAEYAYAIENDLLMYPEDL